MNMHAYSEAIAALASEARAIGPLPAPDCRQEARSRVCGARITVDLCVQEGRLVTAYGHRLQACQIGTASAAILAAWIVGRDRDALTHAMTALDAVLGDASSDLASEHACLAPLRAIAQHPSRHAAARLPWAAARAALDDTTPNAPIILR